MYQLCPVFSHSFSIVLFPPVSSLPQGTVTFDLNSTTTLQLSLFYHEFHLILWEWSYYFNKTKLFAFCIYKQSWFLGNGVRMIA